MVMDAVRGYVQLANGLTEVTKHKAQAAAKALLQQTGADALTTRASDLADEIVATSKSNRQLLQAIVSNEVEGAVARLGFVRSEEVAALTRRVKALETELAEAQAAAAGPAPVVDVPVPAKKAAKKAAAKKTAPAKKAVAKKAAKKAPAKKTAKKV
ncbi:poly(hydroxyalkanoate) granule associated protein phasin [Kribbella sp. VKM Ac-2569]|uniref:phasin family protein n=1 Tax=Kribbella sp. VKM Ac-2569 TaxID=2512220 RepID=UPI00102B01F7|nr:phasin family protein [Kribbella sp. VKM Ac-2569]RZT13091.1 poly(hydroxyalkanoate) granule associated protein phasin [Kribbella sp. VKM Ac-2569]